MTRFKLFCVESLLYFLYPKYRRCYILNKYQAWFIKLLLHINLHYIRYSFQSKMKYNDKQYNVIFHNNRSFIIWMKGSTVSIKLISSPRPPFNLTPRYPIIRSKELLYVSYQKSTTFLLREICKTITFHAGKPPISYNVTFVH